MVSVFIITGKVKRYSAGSSKGRKSASQAGNGGSIPPPAPILITEVPYERLYGNEYE